MFDLINFRLKNGWVNDIKVADFLGAAIIATHPSYIHLEVFVLLEYFSPTCLCSSPLFSYATLLSYLRATHQILINSNHEIKVLIILLFYIWRALLNPKK